MRRCAAFLRTYWTRGEPGRETPRSATVLMLRWWLVAFVFKVLGSSWDVSWHFKWLRDDFAPPHLLNTVGTGIAIILVLVHTFTGYGADRRSLRIMQTGTIIFVIAGPIDVINHRINGLDITAWSPSHMLLYTGTAIMVAGVVRNWYVSYPREGRFAWQYTAGLTALGAFLFENTFFPNYQQEYGIVAIASWFHGTPYAEPSLLDFAAVQIGHPVDDVAVVNFGLPIPAWVYPVWTIGLCAAVLVFLRIMIGRRWAGTAMAALYVGYRTLIWPLLTLSTFPASVIPVWLLGVGIAVDLAFLLPVHAHLRAVLGAVLVTVAGYGALWVQTLASGTPLDLAGKGPAELHAVYEAGFPLHAPPADWTSAWWACLILIGTWLLATLFAQRTIGLDTPRPPKPQVRYAAEPVRDESGYLAGFTAPEPFARTS